MTDYSLAEGWVTMVEARWPSVHCESMLDRNHDWFDESDGVTCGVCRAFIHSYDFAGFANWTMYTRPLRLPSWAQLGRMN